MITCWLETLAEDLGSFLGLTDENCDVMPSNEPKPQCGSLFVGVVGGNVSNPSPEMAGPIVREAYQFTIAVTTRLNANPRYRRKRPYLEDSKAILPICHKIIKRLHGNYDLNAAAAAALSSAEGTGYYNGRLTFRSMPSNPTMVTTDWFGGDPTRENEENIVGMFVPITFDGIRWTNTSE